MLFGNRFSRHAPYSTPFIPEDEDVGGGMAQPKPKVGIFAKGGIGRGVVGSIGDALMAQAGMQPLYAQAMEYQRGEPDRELERELKRAQIEAKAVPRVIETGRGGVIAIDPRTGAPVWEREGAPETTTLQRNFEYFNSLPEDQQKLLRPMMSGYGFTDEGIQAAGQRQAATSAAAKYRAPSGGGGGKVQATRSVGGTAYYKVNGRWYDNPEGR